LRDRIPDFGLRGHELRLFLAVMCDPSEEDYWPLRSGNKKPRWLTCKSKSGSLRVSPRLSSLFMQVIELLEQDQHVCAVCAFECILECLPVGEFPPV
jgi:hypothetical protein